MQRQARTSVRGLIGSRSGNVATIFAISCFVMAGSVGVAIDGGNAYRVRQQLQKAVDSAVLAAARSEGIAPGTGTGVAAKYMEENFGANSGITAAVNTAVASGAVTVDATVDLPTVFMGMLGFETLGLTASAQAAFGAGQAEIALVLDNTGSMSGGKLDGLRAAASQLIETIYTPPGSEAKVKISIVPFAQYVNVGLGYRGASWLSVPNDYTTTSWQCWDTYPNATSSNCSTQTNTCYNDGTPYSCSTQVCDWNYGAPVQVCDNVSSSFTWYGCVASRTHPLDVRTDDNFGTRVPGVMNATCNSALTRLASDKTALQSRISSMVATGDTYIAPGLIWGWRTLAPNGPFGDGSGDTSVRKFIVLMSDGANTRSPIYSPASHDDYNTTTANQLTAETCSNIKNASVTIFVVAFGVTDVAAQSMLQDCASAPPLYYSASGTSELVAAFDSIGQSLTAVRLVR